jgi:ribosome-binding factor A
MAQTSGRAARVADRIKVIVAQTLERGVKDPRLGFVTITDVRVTGDLQHASIFYSVLGDEDAREDTATALESAKGLIRSAIGRGVRLRLTPSIEFIPDAIPESAAHIERLLHEARQRDEAARAVSATASFAGDADPYRRPDEATVEDGTGVAGTPADGTRVDPGTGED